MKLKSKFIRTPGILFIIVLILIIGSIISPHFLTFSNFSKILYQSAILLLIASGMTLVITLGEIDLSPGAVLSLASMVTALIMEMGASVGLSIVAGLTTGFICGVINAFFIVKAKVPAFITTFGMMNMAKGISLGIRDGATIRGLDENFTNTIGGNVGPIPVVVLISLVCFITIYILLTHGKLGSYLFAIGTDKEAAAYSGINVRKFYALPFIITGLLAGIAGVVFTARLNLGHPTGGIGYEFEAIAAVVVGGNSLEGGRSNIIDTLLGVFALSILKNSLTMLGYPIWWQMAISGLVLILALLVPNILKYRLIQIRLGDKQ